MKQSETNLPQHRNNIVATYLLFPTEHNFIVIVSNINDQKALRLDIDNSRLSFSSLLEILFFSLFFGNIFPIYMTFR